MPKVSIITPNFNKGPFLVETILSVQKNTFKDWEMIIIDDGSTDNSLELISSIIQEDLRIKVFQQSNLGGGVARNKGIEEARGQYLLFLDSDDLLTEKLVVHQRVADVERPQHYVLSRAVHDIHVQYVLGGLVADEPEGQRQPLPPLHIYRVRTIDVQGNGTGEIDDHDVQPPVVPAGDSLAIRRAILPLPFSHDCIDKFHHVLR